MATPIVDVQGQDKPVQRDVPVISTHAEEVHLSEQELAKIEISEAVKKQALLAMEKLAKVMKGEESVAAENPEQQQARMVTSVDLKNGILKAEIVPDHLEKADAPLKEDTGEQLAAASSHDPPGIKPQLRAPAMQLG
jgi:hypothetical protein